MPLPLSEFAQEEEDDFGVESLVGEVEEETVKSSQPEQEVTGKWAHLPVNRSLVVVVKGKMRYSRVRHEGSTDGASGMFWRS